MAREVTGGVYQTKSELFRRETVEDEQRPLFSTYDDVEVKVDLESLLMNAKYNNENAVKENGNKSNIDSNSNSNSTSTTTIWALSEASSAAHDKAVVTNVEKRMKLTNLTPIQRNAIPLAMNGLDLVCSAHTGSGKTLALRYQLLKRL